MPNTTRTPTGDYPHPAAVHQLDVEATADKLVERLPGHGRQTESLARESGVSVIMMAMEADDEMKEHSADGVVLVQLLRGHASLSARGQKLELRPGQMILFQPGVRHDVHAEEQSVILLTVTGGAP